MAEAPRYSRDFPEFTRRTVAVLAMQIVFVMLTAELLYVVFHFISPTLFPTVSEIAIWPFLALLAVQFAIIIWLALRWLTETFEIRKDELAHRSGILFRREEVYPFNNVQSITLRQTPVSRLFHYGYIELFVPTLGRSLRLDQIPHPHHYVEAIKRCLPYPDKARFIFHN